MASLDNLGVVRLWAGHLCKTGEQPPRKAGGSLVIREDGSIDYVRGHHVDRTTWGPVKLGMYLPRRKVVLLNGDGFTDRHATNWQTLLRRNVQQQVSVRGRDHVDSIVVIPYAALLAASIEFDSIRPIHVVEDENIQVWHKVEELDQDEFFAAAEGTWKESGNSRTTSVGMIICTQTKVYGFRNTGTGEEVVARPSDYTYGGGPWTQTHVGFQFSPSVWQTLATGQDPNSNVQNGQVRLTYFNEEGISRLADERRVNNERVSTGGWGMLMYGDLPTEPGFYWDEVIHHLGACLFSAVDDSGSRHKFVSAFDEDEPNRMYYLAQLPDRSGATTYREAVLALAPPIVHRARLEGRRVLRQGDVFAVGTNLTDEQVYAAAHTRVRRELVLRDIFNLPYRTLRDMSRRTLRDMSRAWPDPLPGEVREKIDCPCGCGHKRWYGCGPKAKLALSIYGTGHTATEVVTTKKGVTYIRGTMHHDPGLTEPGRQPEHANVILPTGQWFLAVRNTVPRKRRTVSVDVEQLEEVTA